MSKKKYTSSFTPSSHYIAQMLLKIVTLTFTLILTWLFLGSSLFPNKQFNCWIVIYSFFTVHTKIDTMYLGLCPNLLTLSFCVTLNFYYFPIYFHLSLQHCKLRSVKIRNTIFHVVRLWGMIISYEHTLMGL